MNSSATNVGGYAASEMRTYLTGNFLTGLKAAGVPESVPWTPSREVWNGFTQAEKNSSATSSANTAMDTITDALFLPTEREMFGSQTYSNATETDANQGRFAYYSGATARKKYLSNNALAGYWLASPLSASNLPVVFILRC